MLFTPEQIQGNTRDAMVVNAICRDSTRTKYYDTYSIFKDVVGSDDPKYMTQNEGRSDCSTPCRCGIYRSRWTRTPSGPTARSTPVTASSASCISILGKTRTSCFKNEWAVLAIIAANKWQRPICFNSTFEIEPLGIAKYVRQNGLAGQLVPVEPKTSQWRLQQ